MRSGRAKRIEWLGSSKRDLLDLPDEVVRSVGFTLWQVQLGRTPRNAKPLKGFGGARVLELVEDFDTDTYRAVYTIEFEEAVCVIHVFQKKSTRSTATPQRELDVITRRLKQLRQERSK